MMKINEPGGLIKPTGKQLKAYKAGYKAKYEGKPLSDNPNQYGSNISMSSWWESGWYSASRDLM